MKGRFRNVLLFAALAQLMHFAGAFWGPHPGFELLRILFFLAVLYEVYRIYVGARRMHNRLRQDVRVLIEHGLAGELEPLDSLNLAASWCAGYRAAMHDLGTIGNRPDLEQLGDHMLKVMLEPSSPATLRDSRGEQS